MIKSIIKEIFIIILLVLAIILVLGIIFYDYRPSNKKIPSKVAEYTLSEEMSEELNETLTAAETQNIVKTYRVDSTDLGRYEESDDYNKGKVNPFAAPSSNGENSQNNTGNGNSTNNENTSSGSEQNEGDGFFNTVK